MLNVVASIYSRYHLNTSLNRRYCLHHFHRIYGQCYCYHLVAVNKITILIRLFDNPISRATLFLHSYRRRKRNSVSYKEGHHCILKLAYCFRWHQLDSSLWLFQKCKPFFFRLTFGWCPHFKLIQFQMLMQTEGQTQNVFLLTVDAMVWMSSRDTLLWGSVRLICKSSELLLDGDAASCFSKCCKCDCSHRKKKRNKTKNTLNKRSNSLDAGQKWRLFWWQGNWKMQCGIELTFD